MDSAIGDVNRPVDRRMALAREWDDLVREVRGLPGFEDFLRPPPLDKLLPAAAAGPVVVVNVSRWRCDALVITTEGVTAVPLPRLDAETVGARVDSYLRALDEPRIGAPPGGGFRAEREALRVRIRTREETVRSTMEWLWDTTAAPILEALGFAGPMPTGEPPRRMWWCPTGVLSLLPLHGAGHYDGSGQTVVDRVVSSYTPTLRALLEARQAPRPGEKPPVLIVSVPNPPGLRELLDVDREADILERVLPGQCRVLAGDEATPRRVIEAMATHPWVHFSCHGFQNLEDPSRAGLVLNGGRLRVTDFGTGHFAGDLAFLSACQSATGGLALPDEAITLTAALHYTGFRHVIGTLWTVYDDTTASVVEAFYEQMEAHRFDADTAAVALHEAIATVRADRELPLTKWLPYTHTGP